MEGEREHYIMWQVAPCGIADSDRADFTPLSDIRRVERGGLPFPPRDIDARLAHFTCVCKPGQRPGTFTHSNDPRQRRDAVGWVFPRVEERTR